MLTTILFVDEFLTSSATLSPMRMLTPKSLRDLATVNNQSKSGRWVVGGCAVRPTAFKISTTGAKPLVSSASGNMFNFSGS